MSDSADDEPEGPSVIGWVDLPDGTRMTLWTDKTWTVPGYEWMEGGLKMIYSDSYYGPSHGPFGPGQLRSLAKSWGGTVHLEPVDDDDDPELVY